jgi:hypothetical protein
VAQVVLLDLSPFFEKSLLEIPFQQQTQDAVKPKTLLLTLLLMLENQKIKLKLNQDAVHNSL